MTKQQMEQRGEQHAEAGGKLTPFECRAVDAELFAAIRGMGALNGARFYKEMRGAFNKGWGRAYAQMVLTHPA